MWCSHYGEVLAAANWLGFDGGGVGGRGKGKAKRKLTGQGRGVRWVWLGLEDERESEGARSEERGGESRAREGRRTNASSSTAPTERQQKVPSTVLQVVPSMGLEGTGTASAGVQSQN
ncbi:hypothetical protein V496_09643 [Pseudogymnoascus sp. VKM F-4515 (FW-2607)]|nr:hypothetical protein V496_09643 [Pseudogymnoascus sp. VKM F-4515 (FW-2607)]